MENLFHLDMVNLATLTLANGKTYGVATADPDASSLVAELAQAMQLRQDREPESLLLVNVDGNAESYDGGNHRYTPDPPGINKGGSADHAPGDPPSIEPDVDVDVIHCAAEHLVEGDARAVQMMRVSQALVSPAWNEGALLVHSALIERNGWGVLLAGPGDVGKSTASKRIPKPWRAVCDDSALVVHDGHGAYWAHPWPTWSDFMYGGEGGRWDVGQAVRLKAIFFLEQAKVEQVEPVGVGKAICLLLESVGQAMQVSTFKMDESEKRAVHLQRFESVIALMKDMPAYRLRLSKTGTFWDQIDRVLEFDRKDNSRQITANS